MAGPVLFTVPGARFIKLGLSFGRTKLVRLTHLVPKDTTA